MNADELSALVDPPDPNAQARIRIWRILLAGVVVAIACQLGIYFGFVQNWAFRSDPKLVKQRLDMAFPGKSRTMFENATQLTVFSIGDVSQFQCAKPSPQSRPGEFHGYKILGQVQLSDDENQRAKELIRDGLLDDGMRAFCFKPHHGVRAINGKQAVDFVICFKCRQLVTYSEGANREAKIGRQPENYFNQLLTAAGVPFAPDYKP